MRRAMDSSVKQAFPPGHFYSPIPNLDEVRQRGGTIFDRSLRGLPGIDLHAEQQLALLREFLPYYAELPFDDHPHGDVRYGFNNRFFSYGDGIALYSFLRHLAPPRVVEVGSGWSSALMLDTRDRFLDPATELTFIEPYPDRLNQLLRAEDRQHCRVIESAIQDVDLGFFEKLESGDLLFIDSTHVSRVGSDVNRLLLEVVPALPSGVIVHVHDVFWPFEYPKDWVLNGRAWNEDYLLRALLVGNARLKILWFNDFLAEAHRDEVAEVLPLWQKNPGGSIYLQVC